MRNLLKKSFAVLVILVVSLMARATDPYQDTSLPVDERVADLISRMTLTEKISQLGYKSSAISRLGVASYNYWSEAIHGVARSGLATSFPVSIALSSTWNPELVYNIATAISDEARVYNNTSGKGLTYWCPTINMARDPRWGRAEENYGEDVYLTSRIAVSYIKGMQGNDSTYFKTVATAKHFAANNVEKNRYGISSDIDERDLREYYLPAFKACVTEGKVFSVMSAYNAVNGVPCSANRTLLTNILRNEWGFKGFVVSDCDAVSNVWDSHAYVSTAAEATAISILNGDDLNCGSTFSDNAASAISSGLMYEKDIDVALKRAFKARFLLGEFDSGASVPYTSIPDSMLDCKEHQDLALQASHEAIVLLKNDNSFLPLNKDSVHTIAVIGPNANAVQLGGYSGTPSIAVSVLQGIADELGIDISTGVTEAESYSDQSGIKTESCDEGGSDVGYIQNGDYVVYDSVNFGTGKERLDFRVASKNSGGYINFYLDSQTGDPVATYTISSTGAWQTYVTQTYTITKISGIHKVIFKFTGGSGYLFNLNWFRFYNENDVDPTAGDGPICYAQGCTVSGSKDADAFSEAVTMAKKSDYAIVVLGTDLTVSDEGCDRSSLNLPGVQEDLLKQIYRANPKTALVLINNGALSISWAQDSIPAILSAWYDGQAQGTAITDVLFGNYNPKGKLTTTWVKSTSDLPAMTDYNIRNKRTYMYFTGTPLYPFGYGLSYTSFEYSNLNIESGTLAMGDSTEISFDVKNTGKVAGTEVAQMYVHVNSDANVRPNKELKGFANVELEAGETRTVKLHLKHDALSYYDENDKAYLVETGSVDIMVGASSQDIKLTGKIDVSGGTIALTYRQDPFTKIEAEIFENKSSTVKMVGCADSTQSLAGLSNGSYVVYKNLDFSTEAKQISLSLASTVEGATVKIVLDSLAGDQVGTMQISATGSLESFTEQTCTLSRMTGVRDVYLVFGSSASDALRLNWLRFDKSASANELNTGEGKYGFMLYPNPVQSSFTLDYSLEKPSDVKIDIYSAQGALVYSMSKQYQSKGQHQFILDTASAKLNTGIYIVSFRSEGFTKSILMNVVY